MLESIEKIWTIFGYLQEYNTLKHTRFGHFTFSIWRVNTMSFHFYRIDRLADEERLLREKLKIESQIRKHREKNRRTKSVESRKYSQML